MLSPDIILAYAKYKGVTYLYDANNDGRIDTKDIDLIKLNQAHTNTNIIRPNLKCVGM